jgi:hypothetical protein
MLPPAKIIYQIQDMDLVESWSVRRAVYIPVTPLAPPTLYLISSDVTLVKGLLFEGIRTHVEASSTL